VNKAGEVIGSGLSFEKDPVKLGYFRRSALRKVVAAIGGFSPWNGRKRRSISSFPVAVRATRCHLSAAMKTLLLAFVVTLAASPVLAADDGYPPGLFEHSPVQPGSNDPPDSQGAPPDAGNPPDGNASLDDYCANIASHTFHSLAEVKRAHAQCDSPQDNPPPDQ
jgi:hypothetical protein